MGKKMEGLMAMGMALPVPPLLRNLISSLLTLFFTEKYKLHETLRFIILTFYFFFLRFLPSFFIDKYDAVKPRHKFPPDTRNDTAIGRTLSQLLSTFNDIPVSSAKYQLVRSLAQSIIHDNHESGVHELRQVNRLVLSAAFVRAIRQLETTASACGETEDEEYYRLRLKRVVRALRWKVRGGESGVPAEKLAAELMWLAEKMVACGCSEEAVRRWAAASNLGSLALAAEPRLQTSLVKLAAFLFKEAKDLGLDEIEGSKVKLHMQVKLKMLQSWLPLLCRASNGIDAPALSISERAELEMVLEDIIERLEQEEQEQVLSLWLHHFTRCPSSDWPNLHACFARWCSVSRKQLLLE